MSGLGYKLLKKAKSSTGTYTSSKRDAPDVNSRAKMDYGKGKRPQNRRSDVADVVSDEYKLHKKAQPTTGKFRSSERDAAFRDSRTTNDFGNRRRPQTRRSVVVDAVLNEHRLRNKAKPITGKFRSYERDAVIVDSRTKRDYGNGRRAQNRRSEVVGSVLNGYKFRKSKNSDSSLKRTRPHFSDEGALFGKNKFEQKSSEQKRKRIHDEGEERRQPKKTKEQSDLKGEPHAKVDGMQASANMGNMGRHVSKKFPMAKLERVKQSDQTLKNRLSDSYVKPSTHSAGNKKILDDDLAVDDQPMKVKRVIRIDPRDITNKRLDDTITNDENMNTKKEPEEEMSKNAQFRAIQPSPAILSFVENNLLGRIRLIELKRAGYNIDLPAPLDNIPSTNPERERIEDSIFRNKLTFFAAAKISSSFPPPELPEIAFAGRSNVGKSSLLNALTRQWGVARTSDKPGLTQTINFFKLGTKVSLVDLPGYGFAYAKEEVKDSWEELVKEYVSTRVGLKRVCLLIDTKWGMKPRDHELINLMERSQTRYQVVLTKTDTVFPMDVARRAMQIEESLKAHSSAVRPLMMVSSKTGGGIRSLRTVLGKIARFAKV